MRHVAEKLKASVEDLYVQFGWPLYKKFGHAYDAFKIAVAYVFVFYSFVPFWEQKKKKKEESHDILSLSNK